MTREEILHWLRERDPERLEELWALADAVRREHVGDAVHLRGLVEISNHCIRRCAYCGLRAPNRRLRRYRMDDDEIVACARAAARYGFGTVVLQAGEDPALTGPRIAALVRRIKAETPLAVTLSLGERSDDELALWREAGADRYLLRFETSHRALYARIHPPRPGATTDRIAILRRLRALGYEVGSGVMVGIPGQRLDDLVGDIEMFVRLDLDMIGLGPYIAHPDTPLGRHPERFAAPPADQAPADELMTYKMLALARLACPRANIPATTALATLNPAQGYERGLARGANVVMPNLTPARYRADYAIYPNKACIAEEGDESIGRLMARLERMGRPPGVGRGDSPNRLRRALAASAAGK